MQSDTAASLRKERQKREEREERKERKERKEKNCGFDEKGFMEELTYHKHELNRRKEFQSLLKQEIVRNSDGHKKREDWLHKHIKWMTCQMNN